MFFVGFCLLVVLGFFLCGGFFFFFFGKAEDHTDPEILVFDFPASVGNIIYLGERMGCYFISRLPPFGYSYELKSKLLFLEY